MKKLIGGTIVWLGLLGSAAHGAVDLGELVITGSRMAQYNYKVAGNVSVIDHEDIQASNARNIPELLQQELGVHMYDNGTPKTATMDIRGFGDTASRNVLVMVNDRKLNNVDISGPDLMRIPLESVERVEIIRGAGSVLYGDNAVGGVINIITKKGKGDFQGQAGYTYGSYTTKQEDVEFSGEFKNISYYSYARMFDTHGYRQNSSVQADDFNTRLGYTLSEMLSMDMNVAWHEDDTELPGGLSEAEITTFGRRGSADPEDFTQTKDRSVNLVFNLNPFPEDLTFGKIVIDTNYRNRDVYDAFYAFGEFSTKRNIDSKGLTGKYIFDRTVFNHEVNFVAGMDYYDHENDILGSGSNVDDLTIEKTEMGAFGFLQLEMIEDIFLNGGVRYHQAEYEFHQRNVVVDESQRPDEWLYMGGMKYEYAQGSNVYFNVQETFRFLSTDEWYNSANFPLFGITPGLDLTLEQQTGIQYEMGVKHNFFDTVALTVTPYRMDIKNEIFFNPLSFSNDNYDKTTRMGVEVGTTVDVRKILGLQMEVLQKLEFFSNFTYQRPKFIEGISDGRDIPMAPRQQASSGFIAQFGPHFQASVSGRYVGSRFAVNDTLNATDRVKPYALMDTKFSYRSEDWEIFTAVNNVTDEEYFSYVVKSAFSSAKDFFPASERSYLVGVSRRF